MFDHTIRRIGGDDASAARRAPVYIVHNDYTDTSGPQRVRDLLPAPDAERALKRRFAIVNVWRSINGPVTDTPLAFADARTVAKADWIATDLKYPDRTGEVYRVAFNPEHRWFYVPNLQPDEILLLKTFDSAQGRPRPLHAAQRVRGPGDGAGHRKAAEHRIAGAGVLVTHTPSTSPTCHPGRAAARHDPGPMPSRPQRGCGAWVPALAPLGRDDIER